MGRTAFARRGLVGSPMVNIVTSLRLARGPYHQMSASDAFITAFNGHPGAGGLSHRNAAICEKLTGTACETRVAELMLPGSEVTTVTTVTTEPWKQTAASCGRCRCASPAPT